MKSTKQTGVLMIDSILIANRGEIACRIIQTCRKLGIKSIAVYSDADANAKHVQMADMSVNIGPAEASKSYLNADAIIQAAKKTNAKAIHPGYGFLSEQVALPKLCNENDIVWIGPNPEIIEQMGSKITAKQIADDVNVPTIPGFHGKDQDSAALLAQAKEIGFPILIKASAGGGGKGMRLVFAPDDFMENLATAKSEALKAFGDDNVLIEKLITQPRHLEVQLLGDKHGNLIHLFERECSIQRNYQKVIEEAPATFLSDESKSQLHNYALKIGNAVNYDSTGTVEFVLDQSTGEIYFLEVNTRLQVEHTVTEEITGIDLVEQQIFVAAGNKLKLKQEDISYTGHAIEARVNSEDPENGYLPQIGTVKSYAESQSCGIRVDSGIKAGSEISPNYDSMLAKVIGYGASREVAAKRLSDGLKQLYIAGLGTNQAFLVDILQQPRFYDQALTTSFLSDVYPDGWRLDDEVGRIAAAISAWDFCTANIRSGDSIQPWSAGDGFRVLSTESSAVCLVINSGRNNTNYEVKLHQTDKGIKCLFDSGDVLEIDEITNTENLISVQLSDSRKIEFTTVKEGNMLSLGWQGVAFNTNAQLKVYAEAQQSNAGSEALSTVIASMPGVISTVEVSVGQEVKVNDIAITMESMKLIYSLPVLTDGVVSAVHCNAGDMVSMGMPLVEIEPND